MAYIGQSLTEGTRRVYTYVATASQTTFNAVYGVGAVDVYQNGVLLQPSDYTATDGTSVVLGTGAALSDEITIVCHNTFSVADTVSASQGGTFNQPVTIDGNGATVLTVDRATSDGTIIDVQKDGVSRGAIGVSGGTVYVNGVNGKGLGFYNNLIVPTDGTALTNGNADLGTSSYRFKDLYLSGGAYLGGTGAANKLDDYEEGTWSPFWCNTSGQAIFDTAPTTNARYTKIGDTVHATCYMGMPSVFYATAAYSATAALNIGGLPFTANRSGGSDYNAGTVGWYNAFNGHAAGYAPMCYAESGTTRMILVYANGAYVSNFVQSVALYAGSGIIFSVSYKTTA